MSERDLRNRLVKLAFDNPSLRPDILPLLFGGMEKQAVTEETSMFIEWALMRGKRYSPQECQKVLEKLGVPMVGPVKPTRGPLEEGETVRVDKNENTNEMNVDAVEEYHNNVGQVVSVRGDHVVVQFVNGDKVQFFGTKPGKWTGLYRHTTGDAAKSNKLVEVVYISDKNAKPPRKTQVELVKEYVERGYEKGEKRFRPYFTGLALKMSEGKNGFYFTLFPQQRRGYPRSINPTKGQVLYIGQLNRRPSWKKDYERMIRKAM